MLFRILCTVNVILPLAAYVTLQKQLISSPLKCKISTSVLSGVLRLWDACACR